MNVAAVEREVKDLLVVQANDWNEGDLEGFVAVYEDDAVFLAPSGLKRGREEIFRRYVERYRSDGKQMGTLTLDPFDVRVAKDGNAASVALRWTLKWKNDESADGLSLITLRRHDGQWRIHQDASM